LSHRDVIKLAPSQVVVGKTSAKKHEKTITNARPVKKPHLFIKVGPLVAYVSAAKQEPLNVVNAQRQRLMLVAIT
jgi:hypothetical protein